MSEFDDRCKDREPPEIVAGVRRPNRFFEPRPISLRYNRWMMQERVKNVLAATLWQELWINALIIGVMLGSAYFLLRLAGWQ
jgi:hypothetical protein